MQLNESVAVRSAWEIAERYRSGDRAVALGSNGMVGNGYLGFRGTAPDATADDYVACVLTDTYDNADGVWTELATVPNALFLELLVDGATLCWRETGYDTVLDLASGTWHGALEAGDVTVHTERFASLADLHVLVQRTVVTVADGAPGRTVAVRAGIDAAVWSINGTHLTDLRLDHRGDVAVADAVTGQSGIAIAVRSAASVRRGDEVVATAGWARGGDGRILQAWEVTVPGGDSVEIVQRAVVYGANDLPHEAARGHRYRAPFVPAPAAELEGDHGEAPVATAADRLIASLPSHTALRERSAAAWRAAWDRFDVRVADAAVTQAVVRFNTYHSVIATPMHTSHLPIGARGLSCQAYQGAAFWDQEIFNMPMFQFALPEVAENVLEYRARTLDGARAKARKLGYRGAFYAWISGDTGEEICPSYFFKDVISGRPIRNHFNDWQIHISPDIVHALRRYIEWTGDRAILWRADAERRATLAEVVVEVARFLVSRVHLRVDTGTYEILRVLGPDEYHENVDNNAFTNVQTREALLFALEVWDELAVEAPALRVELAHRLAIDDAERDLWRDVAARLFIPAPDDETQLIEQFAGFFEHEDVTPAEVRARLLDPGEYWGWPNGVAVATQVSKQADVLQLMALHPDLYGRETIRRNWEYYEPRTQHGSSLSPAVYAITAAWTGHEAEALRYFGTAATVDLNNTNRAVSGGTFIGGIHTAACGAVWQVLVLGFAGLRAEGDAIRLAPHLPAAWSGLAFTVVRGGVVVRVAISAATLRIEGEADATHEESPLDGRAVSVRVDDAEYRVTPGSIVEIARPIS